MKTKKGNNIFFLRFFKLIYLKLFQTNDSPQKIAQGLCLGVFSGIIPGAGPIVALFLAWILRANRAAALLGGLLTNTWISIAIFLLSIKIGSGILRVDWQDVYNDWLVFSKDFHWLNLFKLSVSKIILPIMVGYLLVAFCAGLAVYLVALVVITQVRYVKNKGRINLPR